jgi:2-iminobutanoate/2-iminopropanoate deaminase
MAAREPVVELYDGLIGTRAPGGVEIGDTVYIPGVLGADPESGRLVEGYEGQLRQAFANLRALLEQADLSLDNVGHVTVFLRDMDGHAVLNRVWPEVFPDPADRPPHKYVPAPMPDGVMIQVQAFAVRGQRRTVLEIPGLSHQDPMSMGGVIHGQLYSSRLFATMPHTGERGQTPQRQAEIVCANVRTLLEQAGLTTADLTAVTAFVPDASLFPVVELAFDELLRANRQATRLNLLEVSLPGGGIRLEIMAARAATS